MMDHMDKTKIVARNYWKTDGIVLRAEIAILLEKAYVLGFERGVEKAMKTYVDGEDGIRATGSDVGDAAQDVLLPAT